MYFLLIFQILKNRKMIKYATFDFAPTADHNFRGFRSMTHYTQGLT